MDGQETSGSTPLFGVFMLSIFSIFIVPYTLSKLFGGDGEDAEVITTRSAPAAAAALTLADVWPLTHTSHTCSSQVVKTWSSKKDGKKQGLADRAAAKLRKAFTTRMLVMWAAYLLLFW
jgi:hypothetical protein